MTFFHTRRFSISQQHSAMKVCTDSLLFGAMAAVRPGDRVLDIGAGSGLLSLMTAQLGAASAAAVEIDAEASRECCVNFKNSPWPDRLTCINTDIQSYAFDTASRYDLIISNPPFFDRHLKSAGSQRRQARHNDALPFANLIAAADRLLTPEGLFYVLLPSHAVAQISKLAAASGFFLARQTSYQGFADKPAKVAALSFRRIPAACITELLTVYLTVGEYTPECSAYLRPFLLRFAEPGEA